ncbi:MAG: long-chain fatty acid--CoA ligase [Deltaproteobacteria bacterium]|nr:long-chain fatty acid--CoA ligase [Deltaproteobacteria bacterium]
MNINLGEFLTKRALLTPDKEALVCEDVRRTFSDLNDRANRLAYAMKKLGVGHGDRVGILAFNEPEYFELFYGLGKIGAILVPINYRLAGPEMQFIISDCEPKVMVFGPEYIEILDSIKKDLPVKEYVAISNEPPEWAKSYESLINESSNKEPELTGGGEDTLAILYTSGTTGRPKGAELTHNNFFWSSVNGSATLMGTGDTALVALPLFHIGALGGVPMYIHRGQRTILLKTLDPQRFLELIEEEKVTAFGSVPALLDFLKLVPDFEKYDFSSVKVILVYAAPVPVTLIKEYAKSGIEVRQLYGMTECCTGTVLDPESAVSKAGSCGRPFFHTDIRIVDVQNNDVGPEEKGEILMRGPVVMKGYWKRPEATADTIVDGWLHSGDIAKMDKDGFYYIMDRKKDMIISGGENIYPAEIEDALLGNPKIMDAAVIGYPHEKWGEAVKAIVVVTQGETLTEEELIEWCQGKIGKFKIPKTVIITEEIPRSPTGKILKTVLREQYN